MNTSHERLSSILLLSIGIMLSGNVFAADSTPNRVTQPEFNAAIANQATINTTLETDIADLKALIEKYHPAQYKIGDQFGGGIIFYVDATGQHGLIASLSDLADLTDGAVEYGIQWYNGVGKVTGATGDGIGAGASNTSIIVAAQAADNPTGIFAAKVAADFSIQDDGLTACTGSVDEICHGDWYLPSRYELKMLRIQKESFPPSFHSYYYWSSNENTIDSAWGSEFYPNSGEFTNGKDFAVGVRAIRAF